MKKNGKLIGILVGTLLLGGIFFGFNKEDDRNFQIVKSLDVFNSVFKELDMFYVDSIDPKEVVEYGIRAMLAKTDPYTEYYPEEDNTLKEMTTGKFGGIGSVIRYYSPRKRVAIIEPSEGHPAAEAGLKAGDIIMEINGKEMIQEDHTPNEMTNHVSDHLRGEPGTLCVIKVDRPTSDSTYVPMEFKITRGTIRTNPVPYYDMLNDSVGYICISTFSVEGCSKEVKRALIELKQKGSEADFGPFFVSAAHFFVSALDKSIDLCYSIIVFSNAVMEPARHEANLQRESRKLRSGSGFCRLHFSPERTG